MRQKISATVDGGTSGPVKRMQTGSEDPHRREGNSNQLFGKLDLFTLSSGFYVVSVMYILHNVAAMSTKGHHYISSFNVTFTKLTKWLNLFIPSYLILV